MLNLRDDQIQMAPPSNTNNNSSILGLLLLLCWRLEREEVKNAETEIKELKRRRVEDAKANEKVVGIFASHQQRWIMEKKRLTQQIHLLLKELKVTNTKGEEAKNISKLLQEKNKLLEEEKSKMREAVEQMNEDHSKEIWKHKCAFIELVSTQRQLEAEMGRAVRQIEAEKQELDAVLEQKQQYVLMTQKLSMELIKTRNDLEQKDQILSAMLRKSKMDSAATLFKMSNKHQVSDKHKHKHSLRSILSRHHKLKPSPTQSQLEEEQDIASQQPITEELAADIKQLEGSVNAFTQQLRLKDEKLEAFHSHSVSMDIETKRLQSLIEGLTHDLTNLKQHSLKVEALLLDRESELHTLKEQMESESYIKTQSIEHDKEVCLEQKNPSPDKDFEDNKNTSLDLISLDGRKKDESSSTWKMDLHALGVLYKIKRLNQQLLMFERLTGKQEISCENSIRQFQSLMSLVNKQVNRYQSLQEKANDICKRMHQKKKDEESKTKEECNKKLEQFLEETFQLQRYIVATGQKLIEIQSKIASGVEGSFEMKKFGDSIPTLFREVQRGLEVRISRIIGDLEGPLACDGIIMIRPRN